MTNESNPWEAVVVDRVTLRNVGRDTYYLAINGYQVPGGPLSRGDLFHLGLLDADSGGLVGVEETATTLLGRIIARPEVRAGQAVRNAARRVLERLRGS